MKLASIGPGDLVLVSKGGRRFHAKVVGISRGVVELQPLERGISYRHAGAREVLDHWRHRRSRADAADDAPEDAVPTQKAQLSFAGPLDRAGVRAR